MLRVLHKITSTLVGARVSWLLGHRNLVSIDGIAMAAILGAVAARPTGKRPNARTIRVIQKAPR
jgi:hypothetical protein